ncbi:MAG TPA: FmdB family zinc ribbon protein [Candidatus Hypogeohydataceae bacterium YC41]
MPTYEYRCEYCGHGFELFESMNSSKTKPCPSCGKKAKRLIGTGGAVIFKGSGFYQTDYRSKDYQQKAKAEKEVKGKVSETSCPPKAD